MAAGGPVAAPATRLAAGAAAAGSDRRLQNRTSTPRMKLMPGSFTPEPWMR